MGVDGEFVGGSAEVDFPALAAKDLVVGLPIIGEAGQQPKAHGFVGIGGCDVEAEPGIGESAELAQGGDDESTVAAGSFVGSVLGCHFWQDEAGQGFLDLEREQSHDESMARGGVASKC